MYLAEQLQVAPDFEDVRRDKPDKLDGAIATLGKDRRGFEGERVLQCKMLKNSRI